MRVRVLRTFKDRNTKALHQKSTEIEITRKRLDEINSTAYGVLVECLPEPDGKKPAKKG